MKEGEAEPREQRAVQSIEVGGRLLLALAEQPGPTTLKDLAARAGLPASRAHPYLVSFGKLGLIEQDAVSARYALGPAALQLGLAALNQSDPLKAAAPVAEALAAATGQTVALAVWANFGPTIVRMIEGREPLHVAMRPGTVMSILGTATGRAFAAVLPLAQVERALLAVPLGGEAPGRQAGAASMKNLAAEVEAAAAEARRHGGLARAVGRPIPGVNAFSAAAFDHDGRAAIAITALGHEDRLPSAWNSPVAEAVRQAAQDISRRLGWQG